MARSKSVRANKVVSLYSGLNNIYVRIRRYFLPFRMLDMLSRSLPDKGTVLDLGCGIGSNTIYLALKNPHLKFIGLDVNKRRINVAKQASQYLKNVDFHVTDFTKQYNLPKTEAVLLIDLLHHMCWSDQFDLLKSCHKVLKKSGVIVIKDVGIWPRWKCYYNRAHDYIFSGDVIHEPPTTLAFSLDKMGFDMPMMIGFSLRPFRSNPIPHVIFLGVKR